jgi:hypothetical protein
MACGAILEPFSALTSKPGRASPMRSARGLIALSEKQYQSRISSSNSLFSRGSEGRGLDQPVELIITEMSADV